MQFVIPVVKWLRDTIADNKTKLKEREETRQKEEEEKKEQKQEEKSNLDPIWLVQILGLPTTANKD